MRIEALSQAVDNTNVSAVMAYVVMLEGLNAEWMGSWVASKISFPARIIWTK